MTILRRDFLNGVAITGLGLARAQAEAAAQECKGYYPPARLGMRGSHPGSFETAHSLRDGTFWKTAPAPQPGEENYDLVIVGAGISGLAAAHFYRRAKPGARILILDNHDDFGGHAKRNEINIADHTELINGGTLEIDSPRPYSAVSDGLLKSLGVFPVALEETCAKKDFYTSLGLGRGIFFNKEVFGADYLTAGIGTRPWKQTLAQAPLTQQVKRDIARIYEAPTDYMPGLTSAIKKDHLSRLSYKDFLLKIVKADPGVIPYFQAMSQDEWGVGIDAVSALDVWSFDFPGFAGLKLDPGSAPRMGNTASGYADGSSYTFHFPDGNASIARLLVRDLIPAAMPGSTAQDVVTARADYSQLDKAANKIRIRLSSIVVGARNLGTPAAPDGTEIAYERQGQLSRVRARNCILAGWNMMIPYLVPDLPQAQKEALHYLVKIPLVYTSVAIRNWRSFAKLRVSEIYAPGCYHTTIRLNPVVDIGTYKSPRSPDEPMIVRMVRVPCTPGLDERTQHRLGHADLLATSFETFEHNIRDQLGRTLGAGGFDPARDITGIAVNRWPHGYAYEYNPLFDPDRAPGQAPHEIGRRPFGRIFIANSDSGAAAYTDCAIDQAHRAVGELLGT